MGTARAESLSLMLREPHIGWYQSDPGRLLGLLARLKSAAVCVFSSTSSGFWDRKKIFTLNEVSLKLLLVGLAVKRTVYSQRYHLGTAKRLEILTILTLSGLEHNPSISRPNLIETLDSPIVGLPTSTQWKHIPYQLLFVTKSKIWVMWTSAFKTGESGCLDGLPISDFLLVINSNSAQDVLVSGIKDLKYE